MTIRKTGSAADQSTIGAEGTQDEPIQVTAATGPPWDEADEEGLGAENAAADSADG